ncbi:hypothetical protein Vadar_023010 [Vaccinium darrowii]|uniref:Uncharacterized protein n=1 Tax=Vaccinium darrowii TaxID=229202 RepID=A0ACB7Y0Z0_9ERIC|nr:hypothetical protein Vadar_023010 [Vaccinium darrowii]
MGMHDLVIHHNGRQYDVRNIDSDMYSYMDLVADTCEVALRNVSARNSLSLELYCFLPGSSVRMEIENDKDVMTMFELLVGFSQIDLYLHVDQQPPNPLEPVDVNTDLRSNDKSEIGKGKYEHGSSSRSTKEVNTGASLVELMWGGLDCYEDVNWSELGHIEEYGVEDELIMYSDSEDLDWDVNEHGGIRDDGDSSTDSGDNSNLDGRLLNEDSEGGMSSYGSDDGDGHLSSDENDVQAINADRYMRGKVFEIKEGEKICLENGMLFEDVSHFRTVLKEYAIERGFKLVRLKNEKSRVTAQCSAPGCKWRIHASPLPDKLTYKIKSLGPEHTCVRVERNAEATSTWIAEKYVRTLRNNPGMTIEAIHDELIEKHGLESSRMQIYRGKRKALEAIEGNHAKAYSKLPQYAVEIRKTNPGSLVKLELERIPPNVNLPTFRRMFISFSAIQEVESECKDSWAFFLYYLHSILGDGPQQRPWTIMSDGQKGIESALLQIMPEAAHRRCCRHLFSNFKGRFPGLKLRSSFWAAARAYTVREFNYAMTVIKDASTEAHDWLMGLPPQMWARHTFDSRVKSEHVTNNMVESFNNWVGNCRGKPVLTLIENIRTKLMGKLHKRYEMGSTWQSLVTPKTRKRLDGVINQSRICKITFAGGEEYQVIEGVVSYVVNLRARTCCCKVWEISGLPCKHAAACISYKRVNIEEYCHSYFHRDTYLRAYGEIIHPVHDETLWEEVAGEPVQPPRLKRLPGRPRKSRRREADEPVPGGGESRRSCTVRCVICKQIGHNKRTCQKAPVRGSTRGRGSIMRARGSSEATTVGNGTTMRGRGITIRGRGRGNRGTRGRGRGAVAGTRGRGAVPGTRGRRSNADTRGRGNAGTSGNGSLAASNSNVSVSSKLL